ncbi:hypothetical protein AAFC00_003605 [Neodothiora populina]|uniref:Uncharacterized protein n=1 Tax=Neodothiora populina TaxID=2781224 RepID=A0ABR3PFV1_9PEZI
MTDSIRPARRRRSRHRKSAAPRHVPLEIRVSNRQAKGSYMYIRVTSEADGERFLRMVDDSIRTNPRDPVVININGYQPWLQGVLRAAINDRWSELPDLNRELQFADTVKFPEKANKRSKGDLPWSFVVDEMNIPKVYYWSFGETPPGYQYTSNVDNYRFRVAVWTCAREAYRLADRVPVTIIFTQPTEPGEFVSRNLLFPHLLAEDDFAWPRTDEEGVSWIFLQLYWLLTDWQNIVREIERGIEEAEINSRGRKTPVKLRTREMHKQVDRIFELKEYLRFHERCFKKLLRLRASNPRSIDGEEDPIWDEMADTIEDLDQWDYYMDSLKERFNNLIELEFNIENANQSDYSRFLSIIAALYLPISFLASIFGITTLTVPAIVYLWIAIPLLVVSLIGILLVPWVMNRFHRIYYPLEEINLQLPRQSFTMLGEELPDSADNPSDVLAETRGRDLSRIRDAASDMSPPRSSSRPRVKPPTKRGQSRDDEKV